MRLKYFIVADSDSSKYDLNRGEIYYNRAYISLHVFEGEKPVLGASLAFRDQDFQLTYTTSSDPQGKVSASVASKANIEYVTIDFIGLRSVVIPFNRLRKKNYIVFHFSLDGTNTSQRTSFTINILQSKKNFVGVKS